MKTLDPIYPISAFQKKQAEVKEAARHDVVRITENGAGAYIFTSEEVFERALREAAEQAAEDALIAHAIERGRADIEAGRYYVGAEAWEEIERRANAHA